MDCNMRSPLLWDWEIEKGEGIESIVYTDSSTSFWPVSKTSNTTSINSSSASPEDKLCKLPPTSESSPGESCSNIDFAQVKTTASAASGESDLCLKLGKEKYSQEFCGRDISMKLLAAPRKKSKSCGESTQVPRCQIDGCELDLSSSKDYHRKHRVCEKHSKCPKVIVGGLERRFCQQCSRLHAVSEFDDKKRSCRKRLSHHNARRRKPQGLIYPVNHDGRQQTNMMWNGISLNRRSEEKYLWGSTSSSSIYDAKPSGFTLSFQSGNSSQEQQLYASSNNRSFSALQTSGGFSVGKSKFQLQGQGVGEYSGVLRESQDFHHALSLLSTSSDPLVQPPHGQPLSRLFSSNGVPKYR